jgi:hypothetical protein
MTGLQIEGDNHAIHDRGQSRQASTEIGKFPNIPAEVRDTYEQFDKKSKKR